MDLTGKKVMILGERDGVSGEAIALCVKGKAAQVVLALTQCFV